MEDNNASDTIAADMCPNNDCQIPAGECWLVAIDSTDLQTEFNGYSPVPTVDLNRTIFIGGRIGNGLANTNDHLILRNSSSSDVDCYSWDSTGICSTLTYITGGTGVDANLDGSDGQSVTNIQGTWYEHEINGSPNNCINTAEGGSPTAVTLQSITASTLTPPLVFLAVSIIIVALFSSLFLFRRKYS